MDRLEEELNDLLDDIGIETESTINNSISEENTHIDQDGIDFQKKEINRTIIAEDAEKVEDISETIVTGNKQVKINISARPKCPNCGYVPTQEDDNPRLKPRCSNCHTRTCSECFAECVKCERIVCKYCSQSYSGLEENLTLCQKHADQARKIDEFEKEFRIWKTQLEKQVEILQEELHFKDLEFDRQLQQEKMEQELQIEELQQEADLAKIANERERIQLEEKKAELEDERERQRIALEEEIERRKRRLEEFEALAEARLNELESKRSHEIELQEQALEEKKQQLDALKELMEISKQKRIQSREDWKLLMDTRERLQEMKWDEFNEFIDISERLQGKTPTRLEYGKGDEEDTRDEIWVEAVQKDQEDE